MASRAAGVSSQPSSDLYSSSIHLLRALLRECDWLPDADARSFCRARTLREYRKAQPQDDFDVLDRQKAIARLRKGREKLKYMRRANEGQRQPLRKVLMQTYGREGPYRRQLLDKLNQPEVPRNQNALETVSMRSDSTPNPRINAQLQALIQSQRHNGPPNDRGAIKRTQPLIPLHNVWLRPLPESRQRNIVKRFHAQLLDRLLLPLPLHQWLRLRALALGESSEIHVNEKRRLQPIKMVVMPKDPETIIMEGIRPKSLGFSRHTRPHIMSSRFLRRIYREVFSISPVMQWNESRQKWDVRWGEQELKDRAIAHINIM